MCVHAFTRIYSLAVKYAPDMKEDDTKALFRQQVPKSFLTLQEECREYVRHCPDWAEPAVENGVRQRLPNGVGPGCDHEEGLVPVMNEEEFRYNAYMDMHVHVCIVHTCRCVHCT